MSKKADTGRLFLTVTLIYHLITSNHAKPTDTTYKSNMEYGIIMDAGSTSTKIHLYSWKAKENIQTVPAITDVNYKKFKPGIGYFHNTSGIENYLVPMFATMKTWLPTTHVASTPVFFMATAGARLLSEDTAEAIIDKVTSVMGNKTINPFLFAQGHVKILSGEEEGFLAWVAVNYLQGYFHSRSSYSESTGIVEFGGGSSQIAYMPEVPIYEDKMTAYIGGRSYDVYTHSYLSYGAIVMTQRIRAYLMWENQHAIALTNPCALKGDSHNVTINDRSIEMVGGGNSTECETILKHYLKRAPEYLCSPKPCTIGSVYGPPIGNMSFVAMGAIFNVAKELKLLDDTDVVVPNDMLNVTRWYCSKTLKEAEEYFGISQNWASSDCQIGLYIPMFLERLGFEENTTAIETKKYIDGTKIVWSLGAIILEEERKYLHDHEN